MKKLLLLLILSLLSAQSFAGSCPDGSEPVKSISADGSYFVYNCGGYNNNAKDTKESEAESPSSKSIYISDKIYNKFIKLPKENKIQSCGFDGYTPMWGVVNKDLAPRIKGHNSKMDNDQVVEGLYTRDVHHKYLEATTFAMVSDDQGLKEKLFDKLYDWAFKDALSATMQCYSNGPKSVLPACEGEWSDPDGQDLAPIKDATVAVETVLSLHYLYKLFYSDYKPKDQRHKVIMGWFESFYPRIKTANDFYFGNSVGWYFPNISIQHSQNKDYKSLIKKMVKGLDDWAFADGSLKNRTTRGDRALWYHYNALGEAFIILEIAKIANVEIPATLEKKLLKAVELFQDAYLDHSVIEPWAKKRHNSQASNGHQDFSSNLDSLSFYSSWLQIFQLRYPEHRTATWLNQELTSKSRSLKSNPITGVTLGCIHKALADSSPKGLAKKEAKRVNATSELSIFDNEGATLSLNIDKVDFINPRITKLERSADYLKPFQLHKAEISGILKPKNNSNIKFWTLVYRHDGDQEQKLVIHIDDKTIRPLKLHKDSLEKKCGAKVMEWGWLSFISKTNDVKSARNQQCIYDYFKEANDSEAFELFQAVLGGTDSILDYLETNVEP
jgi:hypothetical protein